MKEKKYIKTELLPEIKWSNYMRYFVYILIHVLGFQLNNH